MIDSLRKECAAVRRRELRNPTGYALRKGHRGGRVSRTCTNVALQYIERETRPMDGAGQIG